jgi:hypothetical protein
MLLCPSCLKEIDVSLMKTDIKSHELQTVIKHTCPKCGFIIRFHLKIEVIPSKYDILCCLMCAKRNDCPEHCGKHGDKDCCEITMQGCLDSECWDYEEEY